eukprot:c25123_g1_i1 orf=50-835(+)
MPMYGCWSWELRCGFRWRDRLDNPAMAGVNLSDVYQQSRHSLLIVRDGLERLERLESNANLAISSSAAASGKSAVDADLAQLMKREMAQLQAYSVQMDRLWRSQVAKPHQDLWKRKVEQIAEEAESLEMGLNKYLSRQHRRQREAQERVELFQRMNGDSSEGAQILQIFDEEAQAMQSARNSSNMIDEAYATGTAVLAKFAEQRDWLKHAQCKALDILNTVGLSSSVLKLAERRHRTDKWISYVGMIVTFVVVIMIWRWIH